MEEGNRKTIFNFGRGKQRIRDNPRSFYGKDQAALGVEGGV